MSTAPASVGAPADDAGAPPLRAVPGRVVRRVLATVPMGTRLPLDQWLPRHKAVLWLLGLHAPALALYAEVTGEDAATRVGFAAVPLLLALLGSRRRLPRRVRSSIAAVGLMICSALVVHLADGAIEAHFHFFVMIPVIALFEDWVPFSLGVGFVLVEHGIVGTITPAGVYDHHDAWQHPWRFATIHAAFFSAACAASLVHWRLQEDARAEEQALRRRIADSAGRDDLTGLANRVGLIGPGARRLARARAAGVPVAVLVLDLDRFKYVNDALGHRRGDDLLVHVGRTLRDRLREGDHIARLGGDEFAVVAPDADRDDALALAERLREALGRPVPLGGVEVSVEVSIGIALHTGWTASPRARTDAGRADAGHTDAGAEAEPGVEHTQGLITLLREAEAAMYRAKAERGTIAVYDPADAGESRTRLALLTDLRRAVDSDQLVLHYQPQMSLADGRLAGVEALVRWEHPERGLVPPMEFIPLAEATHLIVPLTQRVIRLAVEQIRRWRDAGLDVPVAVNVSPRTLTSGDLCELVAGTLAEFGVPAKLLRVEITESSLAGDPDAAMEVLRRLRALGVSTSMDDFGTGYSSLGLLKHLPVDELKIDRSFVTGMLTVTEDAVLVRAALDLGRNLGMSVVAEGVEDEATASVLRELGCDVAQGYLYAKPLTVGQFEEFMAARALPATA